MSDTDIRLVPLPIDLVMAVKRGAIKVEDLPPAARRELFDFPFSEPAEVVEQEQPRT